jgi:hypothetical protein
MSSVQIHIQGKILEIDKQIYFSTLQGMSKLIPWLAHQVCEDHRYGSINANGSRQTKSLQSKNWAERTASAQLHLWNVVRLQLYRLAERCARYTARAAGFDPADIFYKPIGI